MKTIIFDGRAFAAKKEIELRRKVIKLKRKGITPKLVSILVGDDTASAMYVNMKKKAAERICCKLLVVSCKSTIGKKEIIEKIKKYNADKSVHGIMVQLPLPDNYSEKDRDGIINSIERKKDVDGLRNDSQYLTPTVKSVLYVIKEVGEKLPSKTLPHKVIVVGYRGFEGGKIYKVLRKMGYEVEGVDSKTKDLKDKILNADVLISVTGSTGLIKGDMIKKGAVVIDVGAPKGDVIKDEVIGKASFLSPVPGGIGPVTVVSLLENLIVTCS